MSRRGLTAVAAGLAGLCVMVAGVVSAWADVTFTVNDGSAMMGQKLQVPGTGGTDWFGLYHGVLSDGSSAWFVCMDPTAVTPFSQPMSDPAPLTSYVNGQGDGLTPAQLAELSWLTANVTPTDVATSVAMNIAVRDLMGYTAVSLDGIGGSYSFDVNDPNSLGSYVAGQAGVLGQVQALIAQAQAGYSTWDGASYTFDTNIPADEMMRPGDTFTATVQLPGVPAGVSFDLTANGATVSTAQSDAAGKVVLNWVIPAGGAVYTISASMAGRVPAAFPLYSQAGSGVQSMLLLQPRTVSWGGPQVSVGVGYQPVVSSETVARLVKAGDTLADTIIVKAGVADDPFAGSTSLFGPFPSSAAAQAADLSTMTPVGAAAFSGVFGGDGTATVTSTGLVVPVTGYWRWLETVAANDKTGALAASGSGDEAAETSLAVTPGVASVISSRRAAPGDTITDTVNLTGLAAATPDGEPIAWVLTGSLAGPVKPAGDGTCAGVSYSGAPAAATISQLVDAEKADSRGVLSVTGVGSYQVPVEAGVDGCYSYGYTVTGQAGDGSAVTASQPAGDAAETALVLWPSLSSAASARLAGPGATISDSFTIDNLPDRPGWAYLVTGSLYGPAAPVGAACADPAVWTNAPLVAGAAIYQPIDAGQADGGSLTVTGVGAYTIPPDTAATVCYGYAETLHITVAGVPVASATSIDTVVTVTQALGDTSETVPVLAPTITTQASTQTALPGQPVTDTINLAGLLKDPNLAYSYTGALYGPVRPGPDGTCQDADWAGASQATSFNGTIDQTAIQNDGTLTLTGAGPYTPASSDAGCLTYSETLTVTATDHSTITVVHQPGDATQTILVGLPSVTTQLSARQALPGDTISDSAHLTGLDPANTNTYTGTLYGPVPPSPDGGCDNVDWTGAPAVTTGDQITVDPAGIQTGGTADLTGLAPYQIPETASPACYTYGETLTVQDQTGNTLATVTNPLGDATETVLVTLPVRLAATGGHPAAPNNPWTIAGLLALAGAALAVTAKTRRQTRQTRQTPTPARRAEP